MVHEKAKTTKRKVSCTFATNRQRGGGKREVGAECVRGCVCVCVSSLYALPALLVSVPFVYIWQTCNAPLGRGAVAWWAWQHALCCRLISRQSFLFAVAVEIRIIEIYLRRAQSQLFLWRFVHE